MGNNWPYQATHPGIKGSDYFTTIGDLVPWCRSRWLALQRLKLWSVRSIGRSMGHDVFETNPRTENTRDTEMYNMK